MHLKYCMYTAFDLEINEHPQKVMKNLKITYQAATPQSIGDQWWFWNCKNTPKKLPEYLTVLDVNPMEYIGFGLSEESAKKIKQLDV